MTVPLVYYHADHDGLCSALLAWLSFSRTGEFHAVQYGMPAPLKEVEGRDVYVLDFSWPRADLLLMKERARGLLVLDHHKTAKEDLEGLLFCVFDMDKAGAGLAWDVFGEEACKNALGGHYHAKDRLEHLVRYVQDRDLWLWNEVNSRAVNAFIRSHKMTLEEWDVAFVKQDWYRHAPMAGRSILMAEDRMVDILVRKSMAGAIVGHGMNGSAVQMVRVVNAPVLQSEVGHEILEQYPAFKVAAMFQYVRGEYVFSLRSRKDEVDVSKIARARGGGGHPAAAGFSAPALLEVNGGPIDLWDLDQWDEERRKDSSK